MGGYSTPTIPQQLPLLVKHHLGGLLVAAADLQSN
jgi:hypothetical protein